MIKLLVNSPRGEQQIAEIKQSGGYFDESRVVWDERVDGDLPVITLGGMIRSGNDLVFDQARQDEHDAAMTPPPKRISLDELTPVEGKKLIDFLETNTIVTPARANKLRGN